MRKRVLAILILPALLLVGCAHRAPREVVFQTSTIDALLAGLYDGHISLEELSEHGDFGIGTYDALEGEMVLLENTFYQVKADGKVYLPASDRRTPFATVCNFQGDMEFQLDPGSDYAAVKKQIDRHSPNQNLFNAVRIAGKFDFVKTRSVPRQKPPYPPLKDIAARQPEFMLENVEGTIVGFRSPSFVAGVNVIGYHLHFLSDDRSVGGHILDLKLKRASCAIDIIDNFLLALPADSAEFGKTDLSQDRTEELEEVEK